MTIRDVSGGASCGCICPACKRDLVAKKGLILRHHFAHAVSGDDVTCGGETALHLFCKEALADRRRLRVPGTTMKWDYSDGRTLIDLEVDLEVRRDGWDFIPDAVVCSPGLDRELAVEFVHTHDLGDDKVRSLRLLGVDCLAIYVRDGLDIEDRQVLADFVLFGADREWIYNDIIERRRASDQTIRRSGDLVDSFIPTFIVGRQPRWQAPYDAATQAEVAVLHRALRTMRSGDPEYSSPVMSAREAFDDGVIGVSIRGDRYFAVDATTWQATILDDYLLSARRRGMRPLETTLDDLVEWSMAMGLVDVAVVDINVRTRAVLEHPDFRPVKVVLEDYVVHLERLGLAHLGPWELTSRHTYDLGTHTRRVTFGTALERSPIEVPF